MTPSQLLSLDFTGKRVVIIGPPASGKTHIAKMLAEATGLPLTHTDDYLKHGAVEGLYEMMKDMEAHGWDTPGIWEGVGAYRLLRKGAELDVFYPDVVIEVAAPWEQMERVYRTERPDVDFGRIPGFMKGLETVLKEWRVIMFWRNCEGRVLPKWIRVKNVFSPEEMAVNV